MYEGVDAKENLQNLVKIKCATQAEVVECKSKLRCPRIFEHTNPVTGKNRARYVTFEYSLAFTYSTPSIVKHMNFDFEGQSEPLAVDAIYGDGTKQTKHVELTNFLCHNVNLGWLTQNLRAIQIIYLDTAKESAQAFDSAHIACFEEGIRQPSRTRRRCAECKRFQNTWSFCQLISSQLFQKT